MEDKKITELELESWIKKLAINKPYRISMKNGRGFYEIWFFYREWHHVIRINADDMMSSLKCQKKILEACSLFEGQAKFRSL